MKRDRIADLIERGLITPEPQTRRTYGDSRNDAEEWHVHATGFNHKTHRVRLIRWTQSGNVSLDRPWCGSASRWGSLPNNSVTVGPVTCGRCGPCNDHCKSPAHTR
jgi:hypothetical protein